MKWFHNCKGILARGEMLTFEVNSKLFYIIQINFTRLTKQHITVDIHEEHHKKFPNRKGIFSDVILNIMFTVQHIENYW